MENDKQKNIILGRRTFHSGKIAYQGKVQVQEVLFKIWSCDVSERIGKEGMVEP